MSRMMFCGLTLALLLGCGGGGSELKLVPVKGVLKKGGQPLGGMVVSLEPTDPKSPAPFLVGRTNDAGEFEIQTSAGEKGAPVGTYKVVIPPKVEEFDYANPTKKGPKKETDVIPKNYHTASSTTLSYEVKVSGQPLNIDIP